MGPNFNQNGMYNIPQYDQSAMVNWNQISQRNPMPLPNLSRPPLSGRYITDVSEVTPQDVSMDGRVSFFPTNDNSCIYAKAWAPDGTIQTVRYVPERVEQPAESVSNTDFAIVMEKLNKIEKMLHRPKKPYSKPKGDEKHD